MAKKVEKQESKSKPKVGDINQSQEVAKKKRPDWNYDVDRDLIESVKKAKNFNSLASALSYTPLLDVVDKSKEKKQSFSKTKEICLAHLRLFGSVKMSQFYALIQRVAVLEKKVK